MTELMMLHLSSPRHTLNCFPVVLHQPKLWSCGFIPRWFQFYRSCDLLLCTVMLIKLFAFWTGFQNTVYGEFQRQWLTLKGVFLVHRFPVWSAPVDAQRSVIVSLNCPGGFSDDLPPANTIPARSEPHSLGSGKVIHSARRWRLLGALIGQTVAGQPDPMVSERRVCTAGRHLSASLRCDLTGTQSAHCLTVQFSRHLLF